jgi:hypothetical protein
MLETTLAMAGANLLAPTILFFLLGLVAALARSDLSIPSGAAKVMSIYLLFAIGYKGGVSVSENGINLQLGTSILVGLVVSFLIPFVAYFILRAMTKLDQLNAAAVAGHYGSISIVTFVTATSVLDSAGLDYEGYLIAVAAMMEAPAILSALWLATGGRSINTKVLREIAGNGSIVLLLGSFLIGVITGPQGMEQISPFIVAPFTGVLCIFLLDMGLSAGTNLQKNRKMIDMSIVTFGLIMPLIAAAIGAAAGVILGLSAGGIFLFMTLCASASYIAVPAAVRIALPKAQPGIYLTLALGITFPFNIAIGLNLYLIVAQWLR